MEDIHVVAAILTLALHSGEHGRTQKDDQARHNFTQAGCGSGEMCSAITTSF